MLGRDVVLQAFKLYGVQYLFGNPGTTELPLMDGLVNYPEIEFIVSLHEDVCVGMAAGYAQATGSAGVVNLHAAPGVGHGIGNIYNAFRAGVPLVVTAGQQDTRHAIEEPQLSGEMVNMVQNFTKWSYEVKHADEIAIVLQRAFKMAMTHPQGPVFVSFPSDIMWQETDKQPLPLTQVPKTRGSLEAVQEAAKMMLQAENLVVVAGDRVGCTDSVEALVSFAEMTGARVYVEHQSSALNFPYAHPQCMGRMLPNGPFMQDAFSDADVILFVGPLSHSPLMYFKQPIIPLKTKLIAVDNSEWQIAKNYHIHQAILGDPGSVVEEMHACIKVLANEADLQRFGQQKTKTEQKRNEKDAKRLKDIKETMDQVPLSPAQVMYELNLRLPENALVVDESVTSGGHVHDNLQLKKSRSLIALKGGGLGYGMPAAVGAQLGRPDAKVINVIGDGSSLYYMQCLWNAAKWKLPVLFIILNNQSYMVLKGSLMNINGAAAKHQFFPGMDLTDPPIDFVSLAQGFGVEAQIIKTSEELVSAYEEALLIKDKPILLDVRIDPAIKVFHK
jgi:benzoylformate decarboxylase